MKFSKKKSGLLLLSFVMTGCVNNTTGSTAPAFCDIASPIYIGKEDTLTDLTARNILTYNLIGYRLCGWKKSSKN
ncbi:hypothetical protein AFK69_13715 [Xenorhabdus sp. GDc328]|nr:hypothetical protein AAY47_01745 [Xenorhabdus griffiniae]KOP32761.1 hypothetical protein AFK69_13715 [Xenorhabdus sp. GDc328]